MMPPHGRSFTLYVVRTSRKGANVTSEDELDGIAVELTDYLKKLGLDVQRESKDVITGTRITSLAQESIKFKIATAEPKREPRSSYCILPDAAPTSEMANVYRISEFLDRTIQADKLCKAIVSDEATNRDLSYFVPQRITVNGELAGDTAPEYVSRWLSSSDGGLLAVLAPAGYGKTVLSRVIAHRLAEAHLADTQSPSSPFPFLVPFGDFRRVASFESMVVQALHRQGVTDVTASAFAHLVQRQRCVLILDGFDELLEERPEEARKNLRELLETLRGTSHIMVTARSTFFRTSTDVADFLEHGVSAEAVTVVDLKPFDATQRGELVQKLSPDQRTITYIGNILAVEGVSEAMGSPLLLRETIEALRDPRIRGQLSAETKRSGLFKVLEASVYERERQRHGHRFPDRVQSRFVERAAEEMLRANVRGFDRDSIDVVALEAAGDYDFEASEADFAQLSDHHFLTVDHASALVRFNHQVFREYFQAKALHRAAHDAEPWLRDVVHQRPLPEEVARFTAELEDGEAPFRAICAASGSVSSGGSYAAANLASLAEAFGDRPAVEDLLGALDPAVPVSLRLVGTDLRGIDLAGRMFERLELVDCDLREVDLSETLIRELSVAGGDLTDARFAPGSPEVLQLGYETREFEPLKIQAELRRLGAAGLDPEHESLQAEESKWRQHVEALVASRLKRFVSGVAGGAYLWDVSISEKNLFGGLDQVDRWTTAQRLVPEFVRQGVLTKHREHNSIIFRITEIGKADGHRFLSTGELQGSIEAVLNALVPT